MYGKSGIIKVVNGEINRMHDHVTPLITHYQTDLSHIASCPHVIPWDHANGKQGYYIAPVLAIYSCF